MSLTEERLKLICSQQADEMEKQIAILRECLGPEIDDKIAPIADLITYLRSVAAGNY